MARLIFFNEPYDVLSHFTDRSATGSRATLSGFIDVPGVYPAGRLDRDSEWLLLLTGDVRLQARIAGPRFKPPKSCVVTFEGNVTEGGLDRLRKGVLIKDDPAAPAEAESSADPALWPRDPPVRFRKGVPDRWVRLSEARRSRGPCEPRDAVRSA